MQILFSPKLLKKLKNLKRKNKKLFGSIQKQLQTFQRNPEHPSLRLHKLKGNLEDCWSISAGREHRVLFYYSENKIVFFEFGTHDEVYK